MRVDSGVTVDPKHRAFFLPCMCEGTQGEGSLLRSERVFSGESLVSALLPTSAQDPHLKRLCRG